jgi:RNA polymerase sigma factor (sigma-70 family)
MSTRKQPSALSIEDAYREYRLPLLRLAYLMCGSHHLSEDVVQSAFAAAHRNWGQVHNPLPYLKRAVVNLVKDGQRRRYRVSARLVPPEPEPTVLPPEVDETWSLICRLPWAQRAVVVLHYYEDLPLVEVAHVLSRPESTVRSDHRRALAKLRKAMQ